MIDKNTTGFWQLFKSRQRFYEGDKEVNKEINKTLPLITLNFSFNKKFNGCFLYLILK